ncbi:MAG TPA: M20/M25/M40 family metallo-hydrolase [Thermoanaerobaculia bacterium]|nr:M20/M25/M40 family metallo-hydrolase [Thermoanaerobaculia bacterium]
MGGIHLMNRTAARLLIAALLVSPILALAEEPVDLEMVSRIRDEGFRHSQVLETVRHLTEEIGPRVTGSPGMKAANEWTRQELASWGLQNAHLEAFPFGRGWSYSRGLVQVDQPFERTLLAIPKAWTPGTENGPVRGSLMIVSVTEEKDLEQYRGKVAGKILLIGELRDLVAKPRKVDPRRYTPEALDELALYSGPDKRDPVTQEKEFIQRIELRTAMNRFFAAEKALATIDNSSSDWGMIRATRGGSQNPADPQGIPSVMISAEEYNRLHRLVSAGREVQVEVDVQARFYTDDLNAYNTIAEIPGTDRKGEIVLAGAHLDSWHGGTGATDNAAGCAVMMEAVRILEALGVKPRRTIRIALWSGEEEGLFGSIAYVKDHLGSRPKPKDPDLLKLPAYVWPSSTGPFQAKPEQAKLSAYFNMDNGGGKVRGIYAQENAAVVPLFEAWLGPLHDLGATTVTMQNTGSTDHIPFDAAGIPAFQFIQDELDYSGRTHHSNLDVYDHLEEDDLKQASVVVATFLYDAAMRDEKLPRKHLD